MNYIKEFTNVLDEKGFSYETKNIDEEIDIVKFQASTDLVKRMMVISEFLSNIVSHKLYLADLDIPDDKIVDVLLICNEMNSNYRFAKFVLDEENTIIVEADGFLDEETAGIEANTLLLSAYRNVDELYKKVMKTIWA